ncbi:glutaredoxin [Tulasnella sp. 419]|nr:glutaredoxin [Tulasnella sp. 418]KAG8967972.1 glutaredoxin [Tulasnella sp. 419]
MSSKQLVESAIKGHTITVFSKSYCPYCRRAKGIINELKLKDDQTVKIFELDEMEEGSEIQSYLLEKTGQRTVPNIFINQNHVGGSDDLTRIKSNGELSRLLNRSS